MNTNIKIVTHTHIKMDTTFFSNHKYEDKYSTSFHSLSIIIPTHFGHSVLLYTRRGEGNKSGKEKCLPAMKIRTVVYGAGQGPVMDIN
jgi:hypothetical protein